MGPRPCPGTRTWRPDGDRSHWPVVAVKNVFRDTTARDGSVYDELLVIRPPTRLVGGVLVRF